MADFGGWMPDLPPHGHDGLVVARNVFPGLLGYEPLKSLAAITASMSEDWQGGGAFDDLAGGSVLLSGGNSGLYSYSSGAWTSKYTASPAAGSKWFMAQFGDTVIATHGGAPVKYTLSTATGAALGASPPDASMVAIVRDFVFLAGDSSARSTVTWSAVNNAEGWTVGTGQCDEQLIPDGGDITGLAGGEYGIVFQRNAISVFEYVGSPLIFTRRKVSDTIGCVTHGSIAQAGKMVFFLSSRGFYMFNDGELTPIGRDKVDRTFFGSYSTLNIEGSIRAAIEPNLNLVIWSMPDRLWIYNWGVDKWSEVTSSGIVAVTTGRTGYMTLADLAAEYPGGNDTVPYGTDDPLFQGGEPTLLIAKSDDALYAFGGTSLFPATMQMVKVEAYPGQDAHVRAVRPIGDVVDGITVNMDARARLGDSATRTTTTDLRNNGDMPVLARGRYIQPEIALTEDANWTFMQGLEVQGEAGGAL